MLRQPCVKVRPCRQDQAGIPFVIWMWVWVWVSRSMSSQVASATNTWNLTLYSDVLVCARVWQRRAGRSTSHRLPSHLLQCIQGHDHGIC